MIADPVRIGARSTARRVAAPVVCCLLVACGDPEGVVLLGAEGDQGVRDGWPLELEDTTVSFTDGWSVRFTGYVVSVGGVEIRAGEDVAGAAPGPFVVDLHAGDRALQVIERVSEGRYPDVSFATVVPTTFTNVNASAAAAEALVENRWTHLLEGTGTKGDVTVTFELGVELPTRYTRCPSGEGDALDVRDDEFAELAVSFASAQTFGDALDGATSLRFEAIAAARGDDDVVTWAELADQDLGALVDTSGEPLQDDDGAPVVYDAGTSGATTLQGFMAEALRAQAGLDGAGRCASIEPDDGEP